VNRVAKAILILRGMQAMADGGQRQANQGRTPETADSEHESDDQQYSRSETARLQRAAQQAINAGRHPNQVGKAS
jgi:hypothetical protein